MRSDDGITPKRIQVAGSTRLNAVVSSVRQALSSELDGLLQSSGWPPPMSSSMSETSPTPAAWRPSSDVLPRVAALLDAVRIASSGAAPGRVDVPPSAWSLLRMAAPLCERLRFHFTSGGPADRRDRPEWLFLHTLRMGVAYAPAAAACLPDPPPGTRQMAHTAALTLALAEEAAVVLRSHFLPAMNADAIGGREATRGAWLHLADEARDFDLKLALVVGDTAARIGGASRVLVEKAEWDRHWTRAELDAALRQLDSAVDASDAWHDADPQDETAQAASSLAVLTPAHGMRPVCAVQALSVIQAACTRAAVLPHASQQRAFLREVPAAVAADFLGRVQRRAKGAAAFGDPVAPDSIVRTVSCICAAHVLQTGLEVVAEEPNVWELERQHASRALATMEMQHEHKNGARSGVFSPEVTQAAELKGEWRQALTQALVSQFMADAAALLPSLAAHASGEACAALAPAVLSLGSRIRHIRNSLDDALFADAWYVGRCCLACGRTCADPMHACPGVMWCVVWAHAWLRLLTKMRALR